MRRFLVVFAAAMLAFSAIPLQAGDGTWSVDAVKTPFWETGGDLIRFTCTVDSVDTLTSAVFNVRKYDGAYWGPSTGTETDKTDTTFVPAQPFAYRLSTTSVKGAPKVTAYIEGSFFVDTLFAVVDTLCTDRTSETASISTIDLNNKKYPYYRLVVYGVALCRDDAIFDLVLYAYQKEN